MSAIHPTAVVHPGARLGAGVEVGAYSVVGPEVTLGDGTRVLPHVFLDGATTFGRECTVFPFASIGSQSQDRKFQGARTFVAIGDRTILREYVTVNSGTREGETTRVGDDCLILAYCHVAHGCTVGHRVTMANASALSGEVVVEDEAVIGGMTGVHQFTRIGRLAMVGGMSRITQDVPPFMLVEGNPVVPRGLNLVGLQRRNVAAESQGALKQAYRLLYRENLSTRQALDRIRAELPMGPELEHLLAFIESSERGIVK
jgi:UDP-N-acetylglucosamine acyltransferase